MMRLHVQAEAQAQSRRPNHLEVVAQVRDGAVWYLSVAMEMGRCAQFGGLGSTEWSWKEVMEGAGQLCLPPAYKQVAEQEHCT